MTANLACHRSYLVAEIDGKPLCSHVVLCSSYTQVLKRSPQEGALDVNRPLMEAGFDSMQAGELHGLLQQQFGDPHGLTIAETILYDCPTLSLMAEHFAKQTAAAAPVRISVGRGISVATKAGSPRAAKASPKSATLAARRARQARLTEELQALAQKVSSLISTA